MAISDEITRLQNAKTSIKAAVSSKGVEIPSETTLSNYDEYISQIKTQGEYEEKNVTPSAESQIILPSEGYDALSQVIVEGDIDLTSDNIKKRSKYIWS